MYKRQIDTSPEAKYGFDKDAIARKHKIILGDVVACTLGNSKITRFIYYRQIDSKLELHNEWDAVTFGLDVTAKYSNVKLQFAELFDYFSNNDSLLSISFLASDEGFEELKLDKRCYS